MSKSIRLYWWSEIFIQKKSRENYGDLLGKYLVEKISGKPVVWQRAHKFYFKNLWQPLYVTIGSILEHIGAHCTVWGSGIISRDAQVAGATFIAVRGPLSRKRLQELGYHCPEVYGDPALLLPLYYHPKIERKYPLGILPHINDYKKVCKLYEQHEGVQVIDFNTNDVEQTTKEILSCQHIISSSLHGVIVAHAYQIPAIQVAFSDKIYGDGVKYHDYFMSVGLEPYEPLEIVNSRSTKEHIYDIDTNLNKLPEVTLVQQLQEGLLEVCPFKNKTR
jgi:hypothetical protein